MRDIVSEVGTLYTGVAGLPATITTQTPTVVGAGVVDLRGYDGCMIYILCAGLTDSGSMTPVIQVTNDDGTGSPTSGNWTAVAQSTDTPAGFDLVAWAATSSTNFTPVKRGALQPLAIATGATHLLNQRIGYTGLSFVKSGVTYEADFLRVVSTASGTLTSLLYDVIIVLGRSRIKPSAV